MSLKGVPKRRELKFAIFITNKILALSTGKARKISEINAIVQIKSAIIAISGKPWAMFGAKHVTF